MASGHIMVVFNWLYIRGYGYPRIRMVHCTENSEEPGSTDATHQFLQIATDTQVHIGGKQVFRVGLPSKLWQPSIAMAHLRALLSLS